MAGNRPRPIVTLTTDFGSGSPYVAQMKGVLLSRNTELQIVDITHSIPPQDIRQAALVVDDVCCRFPPHTIHIVVVDPGVGTSRTLVFARLDQQQFIAPDNGVLTRVATKTPPAVIIAITDPLYFLPEVSPTFHGRDIMAPVAAHLSLGLHPEKLGPQRASLVMLPCAEPVVEPRRLLGRVVQVDSFGNIITNVTAAHLAGIPRGAPIAVELGSHRVAGLVQTYGESPPGATVALVGSSGRLEVAKVNGHAASHLGAVVDQEIVVRW